MLQRTSQVGEFYVMGPPAIPLTEADETTINFLDIVIFDEESDRHIVLPWEDAVAASFCTMTGAQLGMASVGQNAVVKLGAGLAQPAAAAYLAVGAAVPVNLLVAAANVANGGAMPAGQGLPVIPGVGNNAPTADLRACEWRDLANCWRIIAKFGVNHDFGPGDGFFPHTNAECALATNNGGDMATDMFTISNRFRGRSMRKFMQVPEFRVYCVIARPFIEHYMMSAIMTVSGRDTGAMLFGPSDMCAASPGKGRERLRNTRRTMVTLP